MFVVPLHFFAQQVQFSRLGERLLLTVSTGAQPFVKVGGALARMHYGVGATVHISSNVK